jgi:UDP-glucuronate 4-epimerase
MQTVLVTGVAGFIGAHVAKALLGQGHRVIGVDNINDYYSVALKHDRLFDVSRCAEDDMFIFHKVDVQDEARLSALIEEHVVTSIIHLAAQAGVRYSLENPQAYIDSNVSGFTSVLEAARKADVAHLVYASSSSVYGNPATSPFSEQDAVDHPVSLYAATKKSNELMAHTYSHLYDLPTTGLRFFTVYGPWGRPDMSPMLFADAMVNKKPINVFNHGDHYRDFTYIDDIVDGILRVWQAPPARQNNAPVRPDMACAPYRVFNIGANEPVHLLTYIETLEAALGETAQKTMLPMQPGDVRSTFADVSSIRGAVGYAPKTSLAKGLSAFAAWYKGYYA